MTTILKRYMQSSTMFDKDGWITVGFYGHQMRISDFYVNAGSTYLTSSGFLALGLPLTDPFWNSPFTEWTNRKAWSSLDIDYDYYEDL